MCSNHRGGQFVGDVGQPLHCENLDVGGNDIHVEYKNRKTNLHAIWDTNIPESISGGSTLASAKSWAATLTTSTYFPFCVPQAAMPESPGTNYLLAMLNMPYGTNTNNLV